MYVRQQQRTTAWHVNNNYCSTERSSNKTVYQKHDEYLEIKAFASWRRDKHSSAAPRTRRQHAIIKQPNYVQSLSKAVARALFTIVRVVSNYKFKDINQSISDERLILIIAVINLAIIQSVTRDKERERGSEIRTRCNTVANCTAPTVHTQHESRTRFCCRH